MPTCLSGTPIPAWPLAFHHHHKKNMKSSELYGASTPTRLGSSNMASNQSLFSPHDTRYRTAPDGNNHTHTHTHTPGRGESCTKLDHIYRSPWTSSSLVYTTPVPNGGGRPRPLGRYSDHVRRPSVYCRCRLSQTKQQRPALHQAIRCYKTLAAVLACPFSHAHAPTPPTRPDRGRK